MKVAGLFAGVGGIELGLSREGFEAALLCEFDPAAQAVLKSRFEGVPLVGDVRSLKRLPKGIDLLTAGFPCQDLSQAGRTKGIEGERSGLVGEVFRLLRNSDVPHVLIENVSFMLQLEQGRAMRFVVDSLRALGYRWGYRVLDSQAFGVPQRRQRVFIFASKEIDPGRVLFGSDVPSPEVPGHQGCACGFYWTEGERGLGWAVDSVPTLKGGSTVGIPSPPAIWMPTGELVTPEIRDVERMQGFPIDWTKPTAEVARETFRWKQMGNAVSVPVARWLGGRISRPGAMKCPMLAEVAPNRRWPTAALDVGGLSVAVDASMWPVHFKRDALVDFLRFPTKPLSARATLGFLQRLHKGQLHLPDGFLDAVEAHLRAMGGTPPRRPSKAERAAVAARSRARRSESAARHRRSSRAALASTGLLFEDGM